MSPNVPPGRSRTSENVRSVRDAASMTDIDEVAVERAVHGDRTVHLNRAELLAAFTTLNTAGRSAKGIGELLGVSERSVTRWRSGEHLPACRPPHRRWSPPVVTCENCGETLVHNVVRHRRRHHSAVSA